MSLRTRRIAALGLAAATVAAGALATVSPATARPLKPAPNVSAADAAAPRLQGVTAAATVHTGSPTSGMSTQASQDGYCDVGDLCLYYYASPTWGSGFDTAHNDQNLNNNHFIFSGSGRGAVVGNNAEAYWNRDPRAYAYICTGTGYTGYCGWLAPNTYGNLNSTYKNNSESLYWGDSAN